MRGAGCTDTLACFPLKDEDPFIIEECPHIFFAGNKPEYAASTITGTDKQQAPCPLAHMRSSHVPCTPCQHLAQSPRIPWADENAEFGLRVWLAGLAC